VTSLFTARDTAAYMQAVRLGHESTSAGQLKRTTREELRRLIYESGIVIARERLRLLNVVGQGLVVTAFVPVFKLNFSLGFNWYCCCCLVILWTPDNKH